MFNKSEKNKCKKCIIYCNVCFIYIIDGQSTKKNCFVWTDDDDIIIIYLFARFTAYCDMMV